MEEENVLSSETSLRCRSVIGVQFEMQFHFMSSRRKACPALHMHLKVRNQETCRQALYIVCTHSCRSCYFQFESRLLPSSRPSHAVGVHGGRGEFIWSLHDFHEGPRNPMERTLPKEEGTRLNKPVQLENKNKSNPPWDSGTREVTLFVFVSWACHKKLPQNGWLNTVLPHLTVLKAGSLKSRCQQDCTSSGGLGDNPFLVSSIFWWLLWHFWACGHIIPNLSACHLPLCMSVSFPLCVYLKKIQMIAFRAN